MLPYWFDQEQARVFDYILYRQKQNTMNRRNFLYWVGIGGLATSLPIAIAACGPDATNSTDTTEPAPDTTDTATEQPAADGLMLGTISDLDSQGSLVIEDPEKVIVVRDPSNSEAVIALTANCNHRDCTVEWAADSQEFVCPCHQSRFALDGSIVDGPATEPLRPLQAEIANDTITVTM
jgi:cytochrome b6-f complex iron-sulfur subunit